MFSLSFACSASFSIIKASFYSYNASSLYSSVTNPFFNFKPEKTVLANLVDIFGFLFLFNLIIG